MNDKPEPPPVVMRKAMTPACRGWKPILPPAALDTGKVLPAGDLANAKSTATPVK